MCAPEAAESSSAIVPPGKSDSRGAADQPLQSKICAVASAQHGAILLVETVQGNKEAQEIFLRENGVTVVPGRVNY